MGGGGIYAGAVRRDCPRLARIELVDYFPFTLGVTSVLDRVLLLI